MIKFPDGFVMTKYSGYFWNVPEQKLYSIKRDGILKPLTYNIGGFFHGYRVPEGYPVSVKGRRLRLTMAYLRTLNNFNRSITQTIEIQL